MVDKTQETCKDMNMKTCKCLGTCNLPNCVRSGQEGKVREQVVAINMEEMEMVKYDAETEVEMDETRKGRVIGPMIARRLSLFGEEMDAISDQEVDTITAMETEVVVEELGHT